MRSSPILSYAFRPFFLLNGIFAIVTVGLWVALLSGQAPAIVNGLTPTWHAHEMLVGFIMATIAGFVLTAGANWTGRPPVSGSALAWLVLSWLLGRIAMLFVTVMPAPLVAVLDMLFPLMLLVLFGREIIAAGNRRNYKLIGILAVLAATNLYYHLGSTGVIGGSERLAVYLLIHVVLLLITVVAGRIIPNFTANWLRARGAERLPGNNAALDAMAVVLTAAAGVGAVAYPAASLTAYLAIGAAVVHALRLSQWSGAATVREPLLLALHVAYAWLPIGYALMAWSILGQLFAPTVALHALTMGAIGSMILAMQTRVPLGHTGRKLTASNAIVVAYLLLSIAVLVRILGPLFTDDYLGTVMWSAIAWIAAFALFVGVYWPILTRPRVD